MTIEECPKVQFPEKSNQVEILIRIKPFGSGFYAEAAWSVHCERKGTFSGHKFAVSDATPELALNKLNEHFGKLFKEHKLTA